MSDNLRLYRTIMGLVLKSKVHFHDLRCLVTFVWAIVGLLMEECVHVSQWSVHRPGKMDAASKQRQLKRWLENTKICAAAIYKPLARAALAEWAGEKAYLGLDSSSLWGRFVIVRVALIYRGRALPLSWLILEHQSTSVAFEAYKHILIEAAGILPRGCRVVLLADRGFDDEDLMRQARDLGWGFRIRLKISLRIYRASKPSVKVGRLMPAKGHALFLHKVWITDRYLGPVHLALAHAQTPEGYQQWAIVSDDPTDLHTFDEYALRFDIEFNFRDAKQFWGLEDFMNVMPTAVTNAANLALFMVDVSQVLMCQYRQDDPNFSVLDLKAYYRGYRYVTETIQMLPQKPDDNLVSQLFHKVAALGRIHPAKVPVPYG